MRVLYAFQGTGNGHIARAQEIVPLLKKYAETDTLISGHQSQLPAAFPVNFKHKGISLLYDRAGGISYRKTFVGNSFLEAFRAIASMELSGYDLIINDFEPLTAWACRIKNYPLIELSHQASLSFAETPKPNNKDFLGELVLNYYAPSDRKIGFHFENYHPQIKKPVIRRKIRELEPDKKGYYVVYLPSFSDQHITDVLKKVPVSWKVFSKNSKLYHRNGNIEIFPIDETHFLESFKNCEGVLCSAGFETPAEALFLGKKLFVIPIHRQYEQECNACALGQMGIPNSGDFKSDEIMSWVGSDFRVRVDYPDDIERTLVTEVLNF